MPSVLSARRRSSMPTPRKDVVAKYLEGYAEPESLFGRRFNRPTDHVLVIPAQDESPTLLHGIQPALSGVSADGGRTLCVVVVNATDAHDCGVHVRNEMLLEGLKDRVHAVPLHGRDETPCWYAETEGFDLVVLDRNAEGHRLPRHEGVGLARKIGCDVALAAIRAGSSRAQLIHTSDCDVRLPNDYFAVTIPRSSAAVVTVFFTNRAARSKSTKPTHATKPIFATTSWACGTQGRLTTFIPSGVASLWHPGPMRLCAVFQSGKRVKISTS